MKNNIKFFIALSKEDKQDILIDVGFKMVIILSVVGFCLSFIL